MAEQAAAAGAKALWLQLGIVSPEARAIAGRAGMDYVENACTAMSIGFCNEFEARACLLPRSSA